MSTENCTKKNKWSNWSLETLNPRMAVFQPRWLTWKTWYRLTHSITEFLAIKFLPTFIWEELVVRHIYLDAGYACMFCHTFILDRSHLNLHCSPHQFFISGLQANNIKEVVFYHPTWYLRLETQAVGSRHYWMFTLWVPLAHVRS